MQTVQRYETGEIHIPTEAVHKCATMLDTPVWAAAGFEDTELRCF